MPLRDFSCKQCHKTQEHFYWASQGMPTMCACGGELEVEPLSAASRLRPTVFPFETMHVNGKKMVIEDLGHLRRVERQYGVVFTAFSNKDSNIDYNIKDLPTYRGYEMGGQR